MRKILLLFAATLMAATAAWAQCPQYFYDTIPAQRYITNFQLVWDDENYECPCLKFEDTFRPDLQLDRKYKIVMYARHANDLNSGCKFRYITQADDPGASLHWNRYEYWPSLSDIDLGLGAQVADRLASSGGMVVQEKLSNYLSVAVQKGAKEVIFFVRPSYKDVNAITGDTKYVSFYGDEGRHDVFNINYFTYTLPSIVRNTLSAPQIVKSGNNLQLEGTIQAFGQVSYKLQERSSGNWLTVQSGTISTADARAGKDIHYEEGWGNGHVPMCEFRLVATDVESGIADTTEVKQVQFLYKQTFNGNDMYRSAGETFYTYKAQDCFDYKVTSELPVTQKADGDIIEWTMPACDLSIDYEKPTYTVKFLNADYTLLKTVEVECGADATSEAPADPEYGTYTFVGWNKDLTNVHSNMSVMARYDIDDYWLDVWIEQHKNEVFPFGDFKNSLNHAMVGDQLAFKVEVFATSAATLYYETAPWSNAEQRFLWDPNSGKKIADYTDATQTRWYDQEVTIAYDANTQYVHPFEYKMGIRFYLIIAGERVYSDPYEIDIYYPMTINSLTGDGVYAENTDGDFVMDFTTMIPARYNDTIRVFGLNSAEGGCLSFARVLYPSRSLDSGLDEQGQAYFICPGETETINVDVTKKVIVFEVPGQQKQWDFSAQGLGKHNGYYAEVVNCGGSIQHMPEDPSEEGSVFIGWKNETTTEYADDAYMNVPAVDDNRLTFTVQWEEIPAVPQYQVRFYGKDGAPLLKDTLVNEGENAVPPMAPEIDGFHFVGWDKPYTTITANTDITALYGEDAKTWTVTYYDADETTKLGEETVNDGAAAQGLIASAPDGYHFTNWVEMGTNGIADLSHVISDMEVYAAYQVNEYTITYTIDGNIIFSENVNHGAMPTQYEAVEDQGKPSTEQYVYTFDHWNPAIAVATEDATYEAVFTQSLRKYTVRFQNWDHTLLKEEPVEYGKAATAPADPTREGYTFKGWDRAFNNIITDMTVTALFEKNKEQGLEDIRVDGDTAQKVLVDGTLYIALPDGRIYNANGLRVK